MKICKKCGVEQPESNFTISDKRYGYLKARCKKCEAARVRAFYAANREYREATKARAAVWDKDNPRTADQWRRTRLKYFYKLTPEQYEVQFEKQGQCCALCGADRVGNTRWRNEYFHVDHCHRTKKLRGILCQKCNVRIGAYEGLMEEIGLERVNAYLAQEWVRDG